jgi:hypothetical protein
MGISKPPYINHYHNHYLENLVLAQPELELPMRLHLEEVLEQKCREELQPL